MKNKLRNQQMQYKNVNAQEVNERTGRRVRGSNKLNQNNKLTLLNDFKCSQDIYFYPVKWNILKHNELCWNMNEYLFMARVHWPYVFIRSLFLTNPSTSKLYIRSQWLCFIWSFILKTYSGVLQRNCHFLRHSLYQDCVSLQLFI